VENFLRFTQRRGKRAISVIKGQSSQARLEMFLGVKQSVVHSDYESPPFVIEGVGTLHTLQNEKY
jgi:hypothetical protein